MKLSNTKIQYNENGSFIDVQDLVSCDVSYSTSGNRSNWKRSGVFVNDTLSIELNFLRGSNTLLDATSKSSEIEMRWNDGSTIYQGTFFIDNKFNTKEGTKTNTYMSLIWLPKLIDGTENVLKKTSTAQGAKSGVQDVQIEGKSIVDEDTGIANITTLATKETTDQLENYCDSLDATKQEAINYITLTGSSGTLTEAQIETLKSNNPRLNYISRLNILLKCVYVIDTKGVYAAAGESKIHVIDASFKTGAWTYKIYSMQPTLTAGANITIKDNVISATGGGEPSQYLKSITKSAEGVVTITDKDGNETVFQTGGGSGGVSQDYVDTQDQAILATATERIDSETSARQSADTALKTSITEESTRATNSEALLARNMSSLDSLLLKEEESRAEMDATLSEAILGETDKRTAADSTLQTNIDNEIVARTEEDVKLQANIEEEATTRQAVDEKLLTAVNSKQDILTAGTNITIVDNVISASGGGSATSFISLRGTSGTLTTDQLKVLGANFANYILVIGTDSTTRRFTFVQEPFPSMDLHYVCINQNKVDLLTIVQGNSRWSITDGSELAKQSDLEAVDAKLGEDENGIYVDL